MSDEGMGEPDGTPRPRPWWDRTLKRSLDVAAASAGLAVAAPLMGVIAAAIHADMGSPVLFRQVRPGFKGAAIRVWKFRTMTNERGPEGRLLPDGERLTRLGRFLRETSLDELPQLINVLRGDMSLVGPRPLLMRYLPRYSRRQRLRMWTTPGITGWAQVNGRNAIDWTNRLELDVWYVENASIWLDLRILAMTAGKVLERSGVLAGGGADFDEFWGEAGPPDPNMRGTVPVEEDERVAPA